MFRHRVGLGFAVVAMALSAGFADEPERIAFEGYGPTAEVLIKQFARTVKHLQSYSDKAVIKLTNDNSFMTMDDQPADFIYRRSDRFRISSCGWV